MRPRMSHNEAKFILESLNLNKANLENKLKSEKLQSEIEKLNGHIQAYDCLIVKYELLASGKRRKGRYSSEVDLADICLMSLGY